MTFLWLVFGAAALVMFIMAFSNVFKGRMGAAAIFGVTAIITAGIAAAIRYA